jgi:hypothetical protein
MSLSPPIACFVARAILRASVTTKIAVTGADDTEIDALPGRMLRVVDSLVSALAPIYVHLGGVSACRLGALGGFGARGRNGRADQECGDRRKCYE